jgi:hypothetical protein
MRGGSIRLQSFRVERHFISAGKRRIALALKLVALAG